MSLFNHNDKEIKDSKNAVGPVSLIFVCLMKRPMRTRFQVDDDAALGSMQLAVAARPLCVDIALYE